MVQGSQFQVADKDFFLEI